MKAKMILVFLAFFGATAALADDAAQKDPTEGMVKADSSFKEAWVHPDTDWSQYDKLYLWDATFEYRDVGPAQRYRGSILNNTHKREFGILEADRQKFEETVSTIFLEEIQKSKRFTIVDEIQPGTLILRGAILDVISRVPPDTVGRSEVYLASVGQATLAIELIDPESGELVAVAAERREIAKPGPRGIDAFSMPANNVTIWADVRRWAKRMATRLRKELDKGA